MQAIPLIRARYVQAFAAAVDAAGARSESLAEELAISPAVFADPDALHPANQLFAFAGGAARMTGRADVGLEAGRAKLEDHGEFGLHVSRSMTLHQALANFCTEALKEYSRAFFWIERHGETTWFCRHKIDGERDGRLQVELYLVELMLQTIRTVAGPGWTPKKIWLQTDEVLALRDTATLSPLNIRFNSPILAIPVPRRLLSRTLPRKLRDRSSLTRTAADAGASCPPADDFLGSLAQVIHTCLPGGRSGIDTLAEATGTSVRTLQRYLRSLGTSYSQLVDEVRMQAALAMLENSKVRLTDIAFELGYSDPAHFTRAFRRWAGVSPSEYRADALEG